jgi:hypothetical protein
VTSASGQRAGRDQQNLFNASVVLIEDKPSGTQRTDRAVHRLSRD